jgi:carboxyl-terminal processing protease
MTNTRALGREILDLLREHFLDQAVLEKWEVDGHALAVQAAAGQGDDQRIDELLLLLGISHTRRFTPQQIEYYHLLDTYAPAGLRSRLRSLFPDGVVRYPGIGVAVAVAERRFFVSAMIPGGQAECCGLLPGDELVSADDVPYAPVASFRGREACSVSLGFRREAQGALRHVEITPTLLSAGTLLATASRDSARVIPRRSKSVAYYKPWSLAGNRYWRPLVNTLSGKLRSCDSLVLDLRGGIGGASPEYAEFFVGRSPELTFLGARQAKRIINPHWRRPVVLLVDATTRSGSEVFAFALQRAGIPIVGARTPGEVAVAKPFILSDESLLLVATCAVAVDGAILEGHGVHPDIAVPYDVAYAGGNDPQLDAALDLAAG